MANNVLGEYIVGPLNNFGSRYLKNLDLELEISDNYKLVSSITAISSLYDSNKEVIFNQTTFTRYNGNSTVNTGFGYRSLFFDDKMIFGINSFYDREVSVSHQRFGIGIELLTTVYDLRGNYYEAFSDTKLVENNDREKALDGWDIRADYHFPNFITGNYDITAFGSYYEWDESGGDFNIEGIKFGLIAKPFRNLFIEAGFDDDGQDDTNFYLLFTYGLIFGDVKPLSNNSTGFLELQNVKHRMYDKVIRENQIVKVVKGAVKVSRGN